VPIITGDTKVVERGKADGVFITTAGVGVTPPGLKLSADAARPGDLVALSGSIGDHGVAVMSKRENLEFGTEIVSDSAPLHGLVAAMVAAGGQGIRVMRDPTRGGLAATLNEFAHQSRVGFSIEEAAILVRPEVAAACEFLGLDPLNVANEGKLVAILAPAVADKVLAATLYFCFAWRGQLPWWVTALVLGRDAMILCLVGFAMATGRARRFPPSVFGKASTFFQLLLATTCVVRAAWPHVPPQPVFTALLSATVAATVWSGIHYLWIATRLPAQATD